MSYILAVPSTKREIGPLPKKQREGCITPGLFECFISFCFVSGSLPTSQGPSFGVIWCDVSLTCVIRLSSGWVLVMWFRDGLEALQILAIMVMVVMTVMT